MSSSPSQFLAKAAIWLLRIIGITLLAGSMASTIGAEQWWVRIWDFPRFQIFVALLISAALLWLFDKQWRPWLPVLLALVAAWQFYRVFPYTPLARPEVALAKNNQVIEDQCFTVMSFNVLQDNREYARTIAMLEREDPDILLLLETDDKWKAALEPTLSGYPFRKDRALSNKYGLMMATRLPMSDTTVQDLAEKDTPSIYTTLSLAGQPFRMIGLHPRPPRPGQNTDERDAELIVAGRYAKQQDIPVLAIGDFNDVAWSDTSSLFGRIGELLDPRIGRGNFATFPADKTWLGWPLDHLFVSEDFLLGEIRVLEDVGSDHRPIIASLCLAHKAADRANDEAETADTEDRSDANEIVQEYREDTVEDAEVP